MYSNNPSAIQRTVTAPCGDNKMLNRDVKNSVNASQSTHSKQILVAKFDIIALYVQEWWQYEYANNNRSSGDKTDSRM